MSMDRTLDGDRMAVAISLRTPSWRTSYRLSSLATAQLFNTCKRDWLLSQSGQAGSCLFFQRCRFALCGSTSTATFSENFICSSGKDCTTVDHIWDLCTDSCDNVFLLLKTLHMIKEGCVGIINHNGLSHLCQSLLAATRADFKDISSRRSRSELLPRQAKFTGSDLLESEHIHHVM